MDNKARAAVLLKITNSILEQFREDDLSISEAIMIFTEIFFRISQVTELSSNELIDLLTKQLNFLKRNESELPN